MFVYRFVVTFVVAATCSVVDANGGGVQNASGCFLKPIWNYTELKFEVGLVYGVSYNPYLQNNQTLLLDVRLPPEDGSNNLRPAAVCLSEGKWKYGSRHDSYSARFCRYLSQAGYVTVMIDYRRTSWEANHTSDWMKIAPWNKWTYLPAKFAAYDAKAAIRFIRRKSSEWRVDPDRISIIGCSAGAISAMLLGYSDIGEGDAYANPSSGYDSSVKAVVAVSGALRHPCGKDANISCNDVVEDRSVDIRSPSQPSLLVVVGKKDIVIPPWLSLELYDRARQAGVPYSEKLFYDAQHCDVNFIVQNHGEKMLGFLYKALNLDGISCPGSEGSGCPQSRCES